MIPETGQRFDSLTSGFVRLTNNSGEFKRLTKLMLVKMLFSVILCLLSVLLVTKEARAYFFLTKGLTNVSLFSGHDRLRWIAIIAKLSPTGSHSEL